MRERLATFHGVGYLISNPEQELLSILRIYRSFAKTSASRMLVYIPLSVGGWGLRRRSSREVKVFRMLLAVTGARSMTSESDRSGTLPDLLEPALHPNHRQFFHGVLFAAGVSIALYKLYQ